MIESLIERLSEEDFSYLLEGVASASKKYVSTGKISEEDFKTLVRGDPTSHHKYIDWMTKAYVDTGADLTHIIDVVSAFHRYAIADRVVNKDIYHYKTLDDLEREVNRVGEEIVQKDKEKATKGEKDAIIRYEDDRWLVVEPLSLEGSRPWGQEGFLGTEKVPWCTTAEWGWKRYWKQGDHIYYMFDKKNRKKYAVRVTPDGRKFVYGKENREIPFEVWAKSIGLKKND